MGASGKLDSRPERPAATRAPFSEPDADSGLSLGRACSSAWIKQSSFPETNFLAGIRFRAGFAFALNGSGGCAAKGE